MKSVHAADPSSKGVVGSTRRHIISRLHKAVQHAQRLLPLLQGRADAARSLAVLEVRGYIASLQGPYYMEKQCWDQCLQQYALAHVAFNILARKQPQRTALSDLLEGTVIPRTTALDGLAVRNVPDDVRADVEAADPSIFAAGAGVGAGAHTTITSSASPSQPTLTTPSGDQCPTEITWCARTVKLEDSAIALALGAVAAAEAELQARFAAPEAAAAPSSRKAAWYDPVIIRSQDAVDATKTAIDELTAEGVDQSDRRMQALQVTRTAVNYRLAAWRIGRNRVALGGGDDGLIREEMRGRTESQPNSRAVSGRRKAAKQHTVQSRLEALRRQLALYDATLQDLGLVKELPGVLGDEALVAELEAKVFYFRALRCIALAHSHILVSKPRNALGLLVRAGWLAEQAAPTLAELSQPTTPAPPSASTPLRLGITASQLQALQAHLARLTLHCQALCELAAMKSAANAVNQQHLPPLVARLGTYPLADVDLSHLVTFPPKMRPIPVKPLFLDIAYNYLEYPGTVPAKSVAGDAQQRQPSKEVAETKPETPTKRGWFGFGRR
ncbi:hypothetical protein KEM52_001477 [Ascosphaera acerosa]|nr:hypothetical protein KEM52_001477 [Ascosphaera acerosa]